MIVGAAAVNEVALLHQAMAHVRHRLYIQLTAPPSTASTYACVLSPVYTQNSHVCQDI
jgi:hypothetical protein